MRTTQFAMATTAASRCSLLDVKGASRVGAGFFAFFRIPAWDCLLIVDLLS
jgi:hypothetical protein